MGRWTRYLTRQVHVLCAFKQPVAVVQFSQGRADRSGIPSIIAGPEVVVGIYNKWIRDHTIGVGPDKYVLGMRPYMCTYLHAREIFASQ